MAYTINLTNGAIFATIPDGTINTDSSVIIIGKNYEGYGEFIGENFVRVLENSAKATPPDNPLTGQLWYDSNLSILNVYNGTTFKTLGTVASQSTEPTAGGAVTGDIWFDTANQQVKVFDGTAYQLVGPLFTSGTDKTGPIVETIKDNGGTDHVVTLNYIAGNVVSVEHTDAPFVPLVPIPGFPGTIAPGVQLADNIAGEVPKFVGSATNAELLDGVDSTGFVSSLNNDTMNGTLGILNDAGMTVGIDSDLAMKIVGPDAYISNDTPDGKIFLQASPSGITQDVITIASVGADARARVATPLSSLDIPNKQYVDDADTLLDNTKLSRDGSNTVTGTLIPSSDATVDFGQLATRYNNIYAVNFVGDLTGNVTGNVTGNLTGNVTGDVTGDVTGNLTGTASNASYATNAGNANYATTAGSVPEPFKFPRNLAGRTYYTNYYNNRSTGIFVSVQCQNINNYRATLMLRISKAGYSTVDCRAMSWVGNADHRTYGMWYVPAYTYYQLRNDDNSTRTIYQWVEWY